MLAVQKKRLYLLKFDERDFLETMNDKINEMHIKKVSQFDNDEDDGFGMYLSSDESITKELINWLMDNYNGGMAIRML